MQLRLLRLFLGFASITWGVSVFGIFVSWSDARLLAPNDCGSIHPYWLLVFNFDGMA